MAWQWRRSGVPFQLLSRVGDDRPDVFRDFLDRHGIPSGPGLVAAGRSASIDIVIQPDLQPFMDNFVEGVWASFRLQPTRRRSSPRRAASTSSSSRARSASSAAWRTRAPRGTSRSRPTSSASATTPSSGWPTPWRTSTSGSWAGRAVLDDPAIVGHPRRRPRTGKLIVVTFGARGVRVFDGRPDGGATASSRSRRCRSRARRSVAATRSSPGSSRRGASRGTCSPPSSAARCSAPRRRRGAAPARRRLRRRGGASARCRRRGRVSRLSRRAPGRASPSRTRPD